MSERPGARFLLLIISACEWLLSLLSLYLCAFPVKYTGAGTRLSHVCVHEFETIFELCHFTHFRDSFSLLVGGSSLFSLSVLPWEESETLPYLSHVIVHE